MSSFNVLIANIKCPNCENTYEGRVQFKYGDTWQLEYRIGDKLKWGGNEIGKPSAKKVKVYGILESDTCPVCAGENKNNEFDILVEDGVIVGVSKLINYDYQDEGKYIVLEN